VETTTTNQCAGLHSSQGKLPKLTPFFSQFLGRRMDRTTLARLLVSVPDFCTTVAQALPFNKVCLPGNYSSSHITRHLPLSSPTDSHFANSLEHLTHIHTLILCSSPLFLLLFFLILFPAKVPGQK
jgi:hypothetical protein